MGMGLFEYADAHPYEGTPEDARQSVAETIQAAENQETVASLKQSIAAEIRQGREPQYILYAAIRAISLLTRDNEWEQQQTAALNATYGDMAQESLFIDRVSTIADRLEHRQTDYAEKTLRKMETSLKACERLEHLLSGAIRELKELSDEPVKE